MRERDQATSMSDGRRAARVPPGALRRENKIEAVQPGELERWARQFDGIALSALCYPLIDRPADEHLLAGYFSSTAVTIRVPHSGVLYCEATGS
jgi:hypothetical protein